MKTRIVWVRWRFIIALVIVSLLAFLTGCAAYPIDKGSRRAEAAWELLDTVDTMQTVQIARHPACFREANPAAAFLYGGSQPPPQRVLLTNMALMLVHSSVSRWFDDRYTHAEARDDGSAGPWAFGRIVWHTVSIVGTGAAVANNFSRGIGPTSARCL